MPRRVPVLGRDGKPVQAESRKWYVEYRDENGQTRRKAGFADRRATEQLAQELERTAEHVRSGYKPKEHGQLSRLLTEHLDEYKADLLAKGTSAKQAQQVYNRCKRILDGCGFAVWSEVSGSKVRRCLADLRKDTEDKRGISAQTSNWYLQAIKGFCAWMVREGRAPENPLADLQGLNVRADRRHERRALTPQECRTLLNAARGGEPVKGMDGPDRALLYRTALESGLRAGELRTLTVGACRLTDEPPALVVLAGYSKHRREDVQPIPAGLAEALAAHTAGKDAEEPIFPTMPRADHVAKMLRRDLKAAGIPYRDGAGHVADFHSLRHSYISNLARAGVHPKVAMDLARHGNINLTMARYSHTAVADRATALDGLPELDEQDEAQVVRATGTYDGRAEAGRFRTENAKQSAKRGGKSAQPSRNKGDRSDRKAFAKPLYGVTPVPRVRIPPSP